MDGKAILPNTALPLGICWLLPLEQSQSFAPVAEGPITDHQWLNRYFQKKVKKPTTHRSVQTELYRFLFFIGWEARKNKDKTPSLSEIDDDLVSRFTHWLRAEHPAELVNKAPTPRLIDGQPNPQWRPFRSANPLSNDSVSKSLNVLSGVFSWLMDQSECPVTANPFRDEANGLGKEKRAVDDFDESLTPYTKALSWNSLQAIYGYLESDYFHGSERSRIAKRWLIDLMYSTAARVATLVELRDTNLKIIDGKWQLRFVTKGNAHVSQEWSAEMMSCLKAYRESVGMHWPPKGTEPPFLWVGGARIDRNKKGSVRDTSVNSMLSTLGKQVVDWVSKHGHKSQRFDITQWTDQDAQQLKSLHAHTIRHTWCSLAVNRFGVDLKIARDHMGHSSVTITERYIARKQGQARWPKRSIEDVASVIEERAKDSGKSRIEWLESNASHLNHSLVERDPLKLSAHDIRWLQNELNVIFEI